MSLKTLLIAAALVVGFSSQSLACMGGENSAIVINDDTVLVVNGLVDSSSNEKYYFADKIAVDGEGSSFSVTDSSGNLTHSVKVSTNAGGYELVVTDMATGAEKTYQGTDRLVRGCNEVKEIN